MVQHRRRLFRSSAASSMQSPSATSVCTSVRILRPGTNLSCPHRGAGRPHCGGRSPPRRSRHTTCRHRSRVDRHRLKARWATARRHPSGSDHPWVFLSS
jgi:hypothetical protein